MSSAWLIALVAFLMAGSVAGLVALLFSGRDQRLEARLQSLSGKALSNPLDQKYSGPISRAAAQALPKMGESIMPQSEAERTQLQTRLLHAGLYKPQALVIFLGVKLLLMASPGIVALIGGTLRFWPLNYGLIFGGCASLFGMLGPSFWLDHRKTSRQLMLRRALPDATDLIVICMEGGLSLSGALQRVVGELWTAHPLLASELNIVQREVQLGQPMASALSAFAKRAQLPEIQSLSGVVKSAEEFGSSMVKALQNYSQTLRLQRQQRAEEMAQMAGTKILFPTLLFIFPSILIIILGPAVIQLAEVLGNMRLK